MARKLKRVTPLHSSEHKWVSVDEEPEVEQPDEQPDEESKDWSSLTKDELKQELEKRGMPVSGLKDELVERLEQAE